MTDPESLVAEEGVDEGSADSTVEAAGEVDRGGLLGEPPHGAPVDETQAAGPVDMEGGQARDTRSRLAPGQQVQEGEG